MHIGTGAAAAVELDIHEEEMLPTELSGTPAVGKGYRITDVVTPFEVGVVTRECVPLIVVATP